MRTTFGGIKKFVLISICEVSIWKFLCILYQVGLNFNAINLKFVLFVDNYVTYNLYKFQIDSSKIGIRTSFFILQKFFLLLIFLRTFLDCFSSFRHKSVCFGCLYIHFWFVLVNFETNLFVLAVSIYIFGLIWFILKQNCLFRLFRNTLETPKQDFHWFKKLTETNAKQILFRLAKV